MKGREPELRSLRMGNLVPPVAALALAPGARTPEPLSRPEAVGRLRRHDGPDPARLGRRSSHAAWRR